MHVIPLGRPMAAIRIGVFGVGQCEAELAKKHLRLNGVTRFGLEDPQLGVDNASATGYCDGMTET